MVMVGVVGFGGLLGGFSLVVMAVGALIGIFARTGVSFFVEPAFPWLHSLQFISNYQNTIPISTPKTSQNPIIFNSLP